MTFRLIKYKIIKLFQLTCCKISRSYSEKYYTKLANSKLKCVGGNLIVKGKISVTDWNQLVIGKNVVIGKNCSFISEGGIYIQDQVIMGDNVNVNTISKEKRINELNSAELNQLFSVQFSAGEMISDNSVFSSERLPELGKIAENSYVPDLFIVSTGRSGTKAISSFLNKHSEISCAHEAKFILNRISTEYAHHFKSESTILHELELIYKGISLNKPSKKIIGECDLKNSNLIPLLLKLNPNVKFIWLIRRADDFVSSAYGRRWFDEYEYTFPNPVKSPDTSSDYSIFDQYRMEYARYRVNGYLAGVFTKEQWKDMDCFERCCWYWNWWNKNIEIELNKIPKSKWIQVKLEKLGESSQQIFDFLEVKNEPGIEVKRMNQAYHETIDRSKWSVHQNEKFDYWCSDLMNTWYAE